jgi:hypothetical protein
MICEDKKRLLDQYQLILRKYAETVAELQQQMGTLSKADYDALYRKTEGLRHDVAESQQHYELHTRSHRC